MLSPNEVSTWDRQAAMLEDVTAFVLEHQPYGGQPLPPLNWRFNEYAVSVDLDEYQLMYGGTEPVFGTPQRGRAEVVEMWAAALGASLVRHGRSDGRVELAVVAYIGPAGRDGKPRTTISIRTKLTESDPGWTSMEPGAKVTVTVAELKGVRR